MKSNEAGTTLKHPESFHGNVKNLSKRMKMKNKGECHFYFKNLTLPLIQNQSLCNLSSILALFGVENQSHGLIKPVLRVKPDSMIWSPKNFKACFKH
jgi:hypothetical protein